MSKNKFDDNRDIVMNFDVSAFNSLKNKNMPSLYNKKEVYRQDKRNFWSYIIKKIRKVFKRDRDIIINFDVSAKNIYPLPDYEPYQGMITDVCIKRKIRNYCMEKYNTSNKND